MSKNPYPVPMGYESTRAPDGIAWVIRKLQTQGPPLFFVREYHTGYDSKIMHHGLVSRRTKTQVCWEYWSPVLSLAMDWGTCNTRWELVIEWMKHLQSSNSLVLTLIEGPVDVVPVKFVDVYRERVPYVRRAPRIKESVVGAEARTFLQWLTTYDGLTKEKPKSPLHIGLYRPKRTQI